MSFVSLSLLVRGCTGGGVGSEREGGGSNVEDVVGSGLGLTIVRDVAEAHGGRLEITPNTEGPGACVTLVLPCS